MSNEIGRQRELLEGGGGRRRGEDDSGKDGVGVFHRDGALKPTPVPSAMTYFPSGFYLDQTGPCKKRICLISSLPAIYDIAGELKWSHPPSNPLGCTRFGNTVHVHSAPRTPTRGAPFAERLHYSGMARCAYH